MPQALDGNGEEQDRQSQRDQQGGSALGHLGGQTDLGSGDEARKASYCQESDESFHGDHPFLPIVCCDCCSSDSYECSRVVTAPHPPSVGPCRLLKGGSWGTLAQTCASKSVCRLRSLILMTRQEFASRDTTSSGRGRAPFTVADSEWRG